MRDRAAEAADGFDDGEAFVPAHLPEPGAFLRGQEVLSGEAHVRVHLTARDLFEERGVYDVTFGYNLARLNLDRRHPDAGFRYAEEGGVEEDAEGGPVLRAEFTPTTSFCPQADTLAKASFRAWNGLADRHGYDLVRVRVAETHDDHDAINADLARLESTYRERGSLPGPGAPDGHDGGGPMPGDATRSPF